MTGLLDHGDHRKASSGTVEPNFFRGCCEVDLVGPSDQQTDQTLGVGEAHLATLRDAYIIEKPLFR